MEAVAEYFEVGVDAVIRTRSRSRTHVRARWVAWSAARELTFRSWTELADYFGANHASMLVASRKLEGDPELSRIRDEICSRFRTKAEREKSS